MIQSKIRKKRLGVLTCTFICQNLSEIHQAVSEIQLLTDADADDAADDDDDGRQVTAIGYRPIGR